MLRRLALLCVLSFSLSPFGARPCVAGDVLRELDEVPLPRQGSALVSVWVRATNRAAENILVQLAVREGAEGKAALRTLNSTRAVQAAWSRIACWLPPATGMTARRGLVLRAPAGAGLEVARATVAEPPEELPPFAPGFVRVEGARLVNDRGPIVFRGVNLTAYSDDDADPSGPVLGACGEEDYRDIAALGFHAVRLTCWYKALMEPGGLDWLRLQRSFARRHGIYIVLDLHVPPGGYQGPEYRGPFWRGERGEQLRGELAAFWRKMAAQLRDDPVVASYDLLNEPRPKTDAQWHALVRQLIAGIRAEGDRHVITVETSMLDDAKWPELDDSSIVYDTHWYTPWDFVAQSKGRPFGAYGGEVMLWGERIVLDRSWLEAQMADAVRWCAVRGVPMQVGEYGVGYEVQTEELGGLRWLADTVALFEEQGISRFYWSWHPFPFGLHQGWYRRDPGPFCAEAARLAAGRP